MRRSYIARVDVLQPDGTFQNGKVTLGLVEAVLVQPGETAPAADRTADEPRSAW